MKTLNNLFNLFIFVIVFSLGFLYVIGQENSSELKDKRVTIKMENAPFGDAIDYLINKYDVAIGFEESSLDTDHNDFDFDTNLPFTRNKELISSDGNTRISVTAKKGYMVEKNRFSIYAVNERLEDVLNTIVKQMKIYNWEINDGVINIFPSKGRDTKFEELLKTNISKFELKPLPKIRFIRPFLYILPEVKDFLLKNELNALTYRNGLLDGLERTMPSDLSFSNLTFKDLLNKITKVKRGGWIIRRGKNFGKEYKDYLEINI